MSSASVSQDEACCFNMLLVRYSEIGLKGQNRGVFEKRLIGNIKRRLENAKIEKDFGSILIRPKDSGKLGDFETLKDIFGIAWFAEAEEIEPSENKIKSAVMKILKSKKPKTFKLFVSRANKKFRKTSVELAKEIGGFCEGKGFEVDLEKPALKIFIDILNKQVLIYTEKHAGLGGLPVGTSGKVLCLLSGGIDSPVAAALMAKRGCTVDFLHFYALRNLDEVRKSKIPKIALRLEKFCGRSKLFLVPFLDFQLAVLEKGEYELQLFRRFMLRLAEKFARENNYAAIVLGDNLNQVASQTLENMTAVQAEIGIPIFRPLLTFDKEEIINLAKKFGTYGISIEKYKDCCSIVAKKPKTTIKKEKLFELEKEIKLNSIVEKTFSKISKFEI